MSGLSINTRQQQQDYHDDYDGQGQDLQGGGGGGNGNGQQQDSSFDDDDDDGMSSSPSIPDENIDFDLVYALHTFVATVEGQASVVKGDALTLLDDSNSYWWLVKVLKTTEVGYIPAENIEVRNHLGWRRERGFWPSLIVKGRRFWHECNYHTTIGSKPYTLQEFACIGMIMNNSLQVGSLRSINDNHFPLFLSFLSF